MGDSNRLHKAVRHTPVCMAHFCSVCDGGLFICSVCSLTERSLTTHCPGVDAFDRGEETYAGKLDFRNGVWIEAKNPTNQMWENARK